MLTPNDGSGIRSPFSISITAGHPFAHETLAIFVFSMRVVLNNFRTMSDSFSSLRYDVRFSTNAIAATIPNATKNSTSHGSCVFGSARAMLKDTTAAPSSANCDHPGFRKLVLLTTFKCRSNLRLRQLAPYRCEYAKPRVKSAL